MKAVSAKATLSSNAKDLFATREIARETFKKVIEARSSSKGSFTVRGLRIHTERLAKK